MATQIYNDTLSLNASSKAYTNTNVYNLFSRYSNKFTYDSTNNVVVYDNRFKFSFCDGGASYNGYIRVYSMDLATNYITIQNINGSATVNVKIVITEHSFVFYTMNNTGSSYGPFCFAIYNKSASNCYVGVSPHSYPSVDAITNFVNINTLAPVANYSIQRITNNPLNSPYVLFSTTSALVSVGGTFEILEDFRSCSNVDNLSTVSINSKNYLAVGTNTLVEAPAS